MINEKKLCKSLDALMHFLDGALGIDRSKNRLSGYNLIVPLTEAAAYNSYLENVTNKTDTIYLRAKNSLTSMMQYSYLEFIKRISQALSLHKEDVILAFDYTDEDFFGEVQGVNTYGWTGEKGVTGKFKFLTCSIVGKCAPKKIPLISLPMQIGHYKSDVILYCLSLIKDYIGEIKLILFDRGFYDKDLMFELTKLNYPYLIFVPKHQDKQSILYPMEIGEKIAIYNEFEVNRYKSKYPGENILVFLKQIYDPRSEKNYDWIFATNIEEILLENLVVTYKQRWQIETDFRVQDEARIKCKSKEIKIRYFLFLYELMLQAIWACFYKKEASFKEFIIELSKMSRRWTKTREA